ncbi:MAG: LysE family translocator [Planctomycetota bacterium]
MTIDVLLAFSLFALVASITPGPNNIMLLASGVNFGFRPTLPHMLGICGGFFIMVVAVGLGIGELFQIVPWSYTALKWLGAAYMMYLAWCIATSGPISEGSTEGRPSKPMSFIGAAAFQWVNPKAWVMSIGAFSTYVPSSGGINLVIQAASIFALINLPCLGVWTLFGFWLRNFLQARGNVVAFNLTMALLLVASLYPLLDAI